MKYLHEFRTPEIARGLIAAIERLCSRPWVVMEVCGGQTHSILKYGLDLLLPESLELIHGPGCPVCVTPLEWIDRAIAIAETPGTILCSFGDMLRVPGTRSDLLAAKAAGADVRTVYSPLDAVDLAQRRPDREVVFFAVGFETTAPGTALAAQRALSLGLANFSLLISHVRVPPALEMLLGAVGNRVQGLLAPGHVCTVMGTHEYAAIAAKYRVPIVVTGFEPADILRGIHCCVAQLERGEFRCENAYRRSVRAAGNTPAQALLRQVFEIVDQPWRGLGVIPGGGLALREPYARYDAERRFARLEARSQEPADCLSGQVLQGIIKPGQCPAFGSSCTPEHPLGATMVSSEGACAAYYRYRQEGVPGAVT